MPLSKKRMRERKKIDRDVKPMSNLTPLGDVKPKAHYLPGKIGIPVKPTQAQKAEWSRFKRSQT